jgi:hypothetical protein
VRVVTLVGVLSSRLALMASVSHISQSSLGNGSPSSLMYVEFVSKLTVCGLMRNPKIWAFITFQSVGEFLTEVLRLRVSGFVSKVPEEPQ